jgi:hypothetical protein
MQVRTRHIGRIPDRLRGVCVAGAALLLLAACSPEAGDWRNAQSADSIEAYDAFVAKYPQSEFAAQATERTKQLGEERDWQTATAADTADAYQQFLSAYPDGKWSQEARVRIENFNVMQGGVTAPAPAPQPVATPAPAVAPPPVVTAAPAVAAPPPAATSTPPVAAQPPAAPAAQPPPKAAPQPAPKPAVAAAAPAVPAPPPSAAAGMHRVQLGAFSNESNALAQWKAARDRFDQLQGLSPLLTPTSGNGARLYRLQAAVRSEADARALCDVLKAGGQPCLYVPAR